MVGLRESQPLTVLPSDRSPLQISRVQGVHNWRHDVHGPSDQCSDRFQGTAGRGPRSPSWTPRQADAVMVGEGDAPVGAVLLASATAADGRQLSPLRPPKGADPRTLRLFPCKPAVFRGPPAGAMIAVVDPPANRRRDGGRGRCPRCGSTCHVSSKRAARQHAP